MTIETAFSSGDTVFFIGFDTMAQRYGILSDKIDVVNIECRDNRWHISYLLCRDRTIMSERTSYTECELFKTKEDLINSL